MSTYSFEEPIGFHLVKAKGAVKTGADAYRAVLDHNAMSEEETLSELAWPNDFTVEKLRDQETAKLRFIDCRGANESHDSFSRPVTILR